jgi:hypothetical protein
MDESGWANYFHNIKVWLKGFGRLGKVRYKKGWGPISFFFKVYTWNIGFCVLVLAGGVEPISNFSQRHRSGLVADKLLDIIEVFDPNHGEDAMDEMWGTRESNETIRKIVPTVWSLLAFAIIFTTLYLRSR